MSGGGLLVSDWAPGCKNETMKTSTFDDDTEVRSCCSLTTTSSAGFTDLPIYCCEKACQFLHLVATRGGSTLKEETIAKSYTHRGDLKWASSVAVIPGLYPRRFGKLFASAPERGSSVTARCSRATRFLNMSTIPPFSCLCRNHSCSDLARLFCLSSYSINSITTV